MWDPIQTGTYFKEGVGALKDDSVSKVLATQTWGPGFDSPAPQQPHKKSGVMVPACGFSNGEREQRLEDVGLAGQLL